MGAKKSEKTLNDLVQAVKDSEGNKTKPYDTTATVTRVEDGKAWVHIPGGVTETPAELTINAKPGDNVMVRVAGGRAFLLGNATNPPTDDATAKKALSNADEALQSAINARIAADSAESSAETARTAAESAVEDASTARTAAESARADATAAKQDAASAKTSANEAKADAASAKDAADAAQSSAQSATQAANGALNGLSTVQDVIGVLDWAKDNATYTLTSDTDIVPGKTYWTRSGDPFVYSPVIFPVKADLDTYYEISGVDEAMADFINAHLALTSKGLYVLKDGSAWKVQISDNGVYIIDPTGVPANQMTGSGNIIGYEGKTHARIDYHSLRLVDRNGDSYLYISDLRNESGIATLRESGIGDGTKTSWLLNFTATDTNYTVSIDGSPTTECTKTTLSFTFNTAPASGKLVEVEYQTTSPDTKAFTLGSRASAISRDLGAYSIALGKNLKASGSYSFAEGYYTTATGSCSHAEGYKTKATVPKSHAEGNKTTASGDSSHAEGNKTTASGAHSHAEGEKTTASGAHSHAEGYSVTASGKESHAEGYSTDASGNYSHAEGIITTASGESSHAEGYHTDASGNYSHAEGYSTDASGNYSHAEGIITTASGNYSHAEGHHTDASGESSHAEGHHTDASGESSHAEGYHTDASGNYSHAEGIFTTASGNYSHAQNQYTIAAKDHQTAIGKFNLEDTEISAINQKALIIGNGTSDSNRSNALTVGWNGNVKFAGKATGNNGTRDIELNITEATIAKYVALGMSLT